MALKDPYWPMRSFFWARAERICSKKMKNSRYKGGDIMRRFFDMIPSHPWTKNFRLNRPLNPTQSFVIPLNRVLDEMKWKRNESKLNRETMDEECFHNDTNGDAS